MDEGRAWRLERGRNGGLETTQIVGFACRAISATQCDASEVDRLGRRRLAAGGIVGIVIEYDVNEILRNARSNSRQVSQFHERRSVAIEHYDGRFAVERHAESHGAGASHRADLIKVLRPVAKRE